MQTDLSEGKVYIPNWPSGYKTFLDNRKHLQPHIDFMLDSFTFSFASADSDKLKDIEKICIGQIGKENLANTRGGRSDKFTINHIGNPIVTNLYNKLV